MRSAQLNLIMIRAQDLLRSRDFYAAIGLSLILEKHGSGPEHYASELGSLVLEIYPGKVETVEQGLLGFQVSDINDCLLALHELGVQPLVSPQNTARGLRAVVLDPDGRKVELLQIAADRTVGAARG